MWCNISGEAAGEMFYWLLLWHYCPTSFAERLKSIRLLISTFHSIVYVTNMKLIYILKASNRPASRKARKFRCDETGQGAERASERLMVHLLGPSPKRTRRSVRLSRCHVRRASVVHRASSEFSLWLETSLENQRLTLQVSRGWVKFHEASASIYAIRNYEHTEVGECLAP